MLDSLIRSRSWVEPLPRRPASDARLRAMRLQMGITARTDPDAFWGLDRMAYLGLDDEERARLREMIESTTRRETT
jgi:hypothetical protein